MKEKRATLEVIAPTAEEAIEKGLADLGLPVEAVDVEILDQGSRGLFGLGSRQARVRLAVKSPQIEEDRNSTKEEPVSGPRGVEPLVTQEEELIGEEVRPAIPADETEEHMQQQGSPDKDYELVIAQETVHDLLDKMKIHARVVAKHGAMDEERGRIPILVDVRGDDLGILIGRRAEVLNALQYISGLIVSKELGYPVSLVVDVEGYRTRREGQLRQLARRMADQAVKTGRRQVLEPMSASERRIIHMELRDHPSVRTESVGEEPRRKVTIILKEQE